MGSSGKHQKAPHVVLLPSAGMGHLAPCDRLAAALLESGCEVSLIAVHPMVTSAEARLLADIFAAFPQIHPLDLHVPPLDDSSKDPFLLQFEAIRRSAHLVAPLLAASSPPLSAFIFDISLASACVPIALSMGLSSYVHFISSAMMLSLCAYFPIFNANKSSASMSEIKIPGLPPIPKAWIPPVLHDPTHLFTTQFVENGLALRKVDGVLINSCGALEQETLAALNSGVVAPGLAPVIPVGPLRPPRLRQSSPIPWLDSQPDRSVVYVCFGNRTALSTAQIKELAAGLERSGYRFLWVLKMKKVDREEEEVDLEEVLGSGFLERVRDTGMVMKGWVEKTEVRRHVAVGGFFSHSGWNSVTEAAPHGVRMLLWALGGDQRMNAAATKRSGMGIWVEEWSWGTEEELVTAEDISQHMRELMDDPSLRASAEAVTAAVTGSRTGSNFSRRDRRRAQGLTSSSQAQGPTSLTPQWNPAQRPGLQQDPSRKTPGRRRRGRHQDPRKPSKTGKFTYSLAHPFPL